MSPKSIPPHAKRKRIHPDRQRIAHPIGSFQIAMNQLFNDFFTNFDLSRFSVFEEKTCFVPDINMLENEKEITVTAELPGMDEEDIEISLSNDTLTIRGEKRQDSEDQNHQSHYVERTFGCFNRMITIPTRVNTDKAHASFKKGVLTIYLPKHKDDMEKRKKIQIKKE